MRWRNYKLLTGDPGYPDYPIPIPPNETLSEDIDLGRVRTFFMGFTLVEFWIESGVLAHELRHENCPILNSVKNERLCVYSSKGAEQELKLSSIPIRPIPLTSLVRLYDLEVDPTEQNDISNSNLEIVEFMLAQLVAFNQTQVPGMLNS